MKRSFLPIQAVLLSVAAAWGAVGCLVTAFELPVTMPVEIICLWIACAIASVILLSFRRGSLLLFLAAVAGSAAWWHYGSLAHQLLAILARIAKVYDGGYDWGIPEFLRYAGGKMDYGLAFLGMAETAVVSLALLRRKADTPALMLLVLPLAACLVVTDTVPELPYLFVLLGCLALIIITNSVRAESTGQSSRLIWGALIPTVLSLALLFHFFPQNSYVNRSAPIREKLAQYVRELPTKMQEAELTLPAFIRPQERVNLASLGQQPQLGLPVGEISAEQDGTVYLRVRDYDKYTGTAWVSDADRQETLVGTGSAKGAVVVRELSSQGGMLLPSFPSGDTWLINGTASSPEGEKVYQFDRMTDALAAQPGDYWLALPEHTKTEAQKILNTIPRGSSVQARAAAIADYVRGCAVYDRNTAPMPAEEDDFALWFLRSAETGYCVHFASSAAVLLRAAGIPARYVTGYKAEIAERTDTRITSNDAHAWVEYYDHQSWTWHILEATPGELELTPTETEPETTEATQSTQPTAETRAASTTPTSASTEPEPEAPEQKFSIPKEYWITALALLLFFGTLELQRSVRLRLRRRKQRQGTPNERAIARWKELGILTRLAGVSPSEELSELAEKAMFSQHTLSKEELTVFTAFTRRCRTTLRSRPLWKRVGYRYWYAVI